MKFKSVEHKRQYEEHQKWLQENGIAAPTRRLRGVGFPEYTPPSKSLPATTANMQYHWAKGSRDMMDPTYRDAVEDKAKSLAPSYSKGPYQPQSNLDFTKSRRRD